VENTSDNINSKELVLEYPCVWEYRLVTTADTDIHEIAEGILGSRAHKLEASKTSKKGAFKSYALKLEVANDEDRKGIFASLREHQNIKFVL